MKSTTITETDTLVVRHAVLLPGETTQWHRDACRRLTVVVRGDRLAIEYRDGGEVDAFDVVPGRADWDEPQPRVHRAVNCGAMPFEEIVTLPPCSRRRAATDRGLGANRPNGPGDG